MESVIGAARWVIGRALSPVTDGLLESWTASSELGPNVQELKMELLYAEGMLNNARGWDLHNRALEQLLLELRNVAYNADDVLDELEYFRIQDELDGTYETIDAQDQGAIGGLVLNVRHTTIAITKCLSGVCSCGGGRTHDDDDDDGDHQEASRGCMTKVISSARNTAQAVGKHIPCPSLPRKWRSKAQQREHVVPAPKLKFDRVEISQRMKHIVEQLKPLCAKVSTILGLEIFRFNHSMAHSVAPERPKTTPEIIEFKLYGRDNLKRNFLDCITHGKYCANSLTVVSIVGPGGIGKTAFTQHIYQEVSNHFQVLVWICVSQNFNANRLAQEIVNKIPRNENEKDNASDEELIQIRLQSKRFLLVLDDMWTYHEDEWKKLRAPFEKVGTTGNVVIVTTRIPKVAKMVATVDCLIRLERLDDNDCKPFFQACVLGDQHSWEKHADLHELGDEIVKKLKGFPLAVKTVGRLLRNKLTAEHWRRVLESKEWELHSGDDDIMPALKLSYNYLPFDLQQCFSRCALFPEDYEFGREELIRFWVGLGLLDKCDQKNNRMEDVGSDYLDALLDHGFFQKSENADAQPNYVIHDLLHELAISVSANECLSIHGSNVRSIQVPTSIRHLSISIDNTHVNDRMAFENIKTDLTLLLGKKMKVENLRTLMLFGQYHGSFFKTFCDLFRKAKSLRVILLSGASYDVEDLFCNFSQLIHLRYIRISTMMGYYYHPLFDLISLPSSIPNCYHLMVLDIEECFCDLGSLGREMRNLVKLRHLVAPDYMDFHSSIFEVGKLKSLQELSEFEVKRETNGFELKQLGQLRELQGSLRIDSLERVEDAKEAEEAKLVHMNHLHGLRLRWEASQSTKDAKQEEDILESLKPHSYLRGVSIEGHRGTSCPSWLGEDLSISNLELLHLNDVAWKKFPPLGELCTTNEHGEECTSYITSQRFLNLKSIELCSLPRLKMWRGSDSSQLFSCLEELTVSRCSELLELPFSHCTCSQAKQRFPKLREIDISDCPKLLSLPPIPWTNDLRRASIFRVGSGIEKLYYYDKYAYLDSEVWNVLSFHNLCQIEDLSISNCPPMPLQHLQMLASLKTLCIRDCTNVLWPIEGDSNAQFQIPVEYLEITSCDASGKELTQLMCYFPKLRSLSLDECKMITELGVTEKHTAAKQVPLLSASACKTEDTHIAQQQQQTRGEEIEEVNEGDGVLLMPRELLRLQIYGCPDLRLCPGTLDESTEAREEGLQGLRSLTSLYIRSCPKFFASSASSAYSPFPASLQTLTIDHCTHLTGKAFWERFPQGCLTKLIVFESPNFFSCTTDTELSPRLNQQDIPHDSRSCELRTDDIAGALAHPICDCLSPFLTKLVFWGNRDVERFTDAQEAALQTLILLQELEFSSCSKLQSLPVGLSGLPNLKRFEIEYLHFIQSIPKDGLPSSLTELRIDGCAAIRSLPKGSLPSSLQTLKISQCPSIRSLEFTLPSSLQNLEIWNCESIRSLPKDGLPDSLRLLVVRTANEELRRQCRKLKGTIPIVKA